MKNGGLVCRWLIPNAVVINGVVLQKNVFCRGTFFRVVSSKNTKLRAEGKGTPFASPEGRSPAPLTGMTETCEIGRTVLFFGGSCVIIQNTSGADHPGALAVFCVIIALFNVRSYFFDLEKKELFSNSCLTFRTAAYAFAVGGAEADIQEL